MKEQHQLPVRRILDIKYNEAIERTGGPADRFVMNRATLKALCKEGLNDVRLFEKLYRGPNWFYRDIPIGVREDLKNNEVFAIFK